MTQSGAWGRRGTGVSSKNDTAGRSEARRDHDRIFYSAEFERLEDVTQIATLTSSSVRNRFTHSMRVEQIARSIASKFESQLNDPDFADVVMSAALAHDMGHAPFGHTGEEALQKVVMCTKHRLEHPTTFDERVDDAATAANGGNRKNECRDGVCLLPDGFEGNAQTFRILTLLSTNHPTSEIDGLQLTRRTLEASLKYPWVYGARRDKLHKWGVYDSDLATAKWVYEEGQPFDPSTSKEQSVEASVMDIADDIAYAVHDLEDAFKAGLVRFSDLQLQPISPALRLLIDYIRAESTTDGNAQPPLNGSPLITLIEEFDKYTAALSDKKGELHEYPALELLQSRLRTIGQTAYGSGVKGRLDLSRWRGDLIATFMNSVKLGPAAEFDSAEMKAVIEFFKQVTWYFVIDNSDLTAIRLGQEDLIARCFESLFGQATAAYLADPAKEFSAWSTKATHRLQKRLPERLVDYVALGRKQHERESEQTPNYYRPRHIVARAVVDYICSLTDSEVYAYSLQVGGSPAHSIPRAFS